MHNARNDHWSLIETRYMNIPAPCVEELQDAVTLLVKQWGQNLNLTQQIEEKETRVETYSYSRSMITDSSGARKS